MRSLWGVALWPNMRLRRHEELPMQSWLGGEVIWSAPRPIALAFFPALSSASFAGQIVLSFYTRPRPGQEGMEISAIIVIGNICWPRSFFTFG